MIKKLVFAAAISLMAVPQAGAWNDILNSVWGSKGNLYTAEVGFGRRAQKFRRMQ